MSRRDITLIILTGLSVTASVAGLVIAGKPHQVIPGGSVPVSMWLFPLIFIFGSILTEIHGPKTARAVTLVTFGCTLVAMAYNLLTIWLPYPEFWQDQDAYIRVLMKTPQIMIASSVAYLVAAYTNIGVLILVKWRTGDRLLWLRIVLAAIASQIVDSALFVGLAYWSRAPWDQIVSMIVTSAILKVGMQLCGIPLSYLAVKYVKEKIEDGSQISNARLA